MTFFLSTRRNIELSKSTREEIEMFNCWLLIILVTGYWFAYYAVHLRISSRQVSDSCADKLHALLRHNFCVYRYKTYIMGHNHHQEAAYHFEQAAKHHQKAQQLHESGDHEQEAHEAYLAFGHHNFADHHVKDASEHHANRHQQGHSDPVD